MPDNDDELTLAGMLFEAARVSNRIINLPTGRLIRLLRKRRQMSQIELAKQSGFRQAQISGIEKGKIDLRLSGLKKIFEALHCRPALLARAGADFDKMDPKQELDF